MADEADIASELIDNEVSRALSKIQKNFDNKPGPEFCIECEETMPIPRREMGFKRCMACAEARERRQSMFAS